MRSARSLAFLCLALVALLALSGQAFSTTVAVGSCTPYVNFATIQQAVNASPSGTVIKVCPGTYHEQVAINESLTLEGVAYAIEDAVVIAPPKGGLVANAVDMDPEPPNSGAPIAAQILVENATTAITVTISNLTVDGLGNQVSGCSPNVVGILYSNASGTVNHVAVRNQVPGDTLSGCQSGEAIYVQTSTGASVVTVENSSVHNYNKNGITGNDAGTTLNVTGSYVEGSGALGDGYSAQNGIQIAFGAAGKVTTSVVTDNSYVGPTYGASDILLYDAAENSSIAITGNIAGNSQIPIGLYTDTAGLGDGVTVTSNKIFGALTFDAIDVCTNGNTLKLNNIFNSAESGIHLDASCGSTGTGNTLASNTILESACAGILDDTGGSSNTIVSGTYYTVPFPVTGSTASCTIPGPAGSTADARSTRAKAARKFSPAR
jgi:hypothetical protein